MAAILVKFEQGWEDGLTNFLFACNSRSGKGLRAPPRHAVHYSIGPAQTGKLFIIAEKFESIWPLRSSQIASPWRGRRGENWQQVRPPKLVNSFVRNGAQPFEIVFARKPMNFYTVHCGLWSLCGQQDGFLLI